MALMDHFFRAHEARYPNRVSRTILSSALCLSMLSSAAADEVTQSPLEPVTVNPISSSPGTTTSDQGTTSIRLLRKEPDRTAVGSSAQSCDGKLGVHRTIKVSPKNAFLVGVDNHARLGLKKKEVVLTFDDGPRAGITEPILRALAEECVLATFFAMGRAAREFPHLLARTAKEGHTIGTHTQSHPLLTKQSNDGVRAEVRRGIASAEAALQGSGRELSNFFRYPYLGRSKRTDGIVKSFGLVGFHMNIDSWDWKDQTPDEMLKTTLRRTRGEGSGIVLFHDIQEKTAIALPKYLRILRQEGYKIVHLVPGDSDFDYRVDLASRVPPPSKRPNNEGASLVTASTGAATPADAETVTRQAALQSLNKDVEDNLDIVSTDPAVETASLKEKRAIAATRLREFKVRQKIEKQERAERLAALGPPPLPKRRPRKTRNLTRKTATATELRGSQSADSELGEVIFSSNTEVSNQSTTAASGFEPQPPKKKKRFRRLRKLFTATGDR